MQLQSTVNLFNPNAEREAPQALPVRPSCDGKLLWMSKSLLLLTLMAMLSANIQTPTGGQPSLAAEYPYDTKALT